MSIKVLDPEKNFKLLPYTEGKGVAKAIIWPGMGAKLGSMHYFVMAPGARNVPHKHPEAEDMFYVVQGQGVVIDFDQGKEYPFKKGDFVFIPAGITHAVRSDGPEDFISVGGPSPADEAMYVHEKGEKRGQN